MPLSRGMFMQVSEQDLALAKSRRWHANPTYKGFLRYYAAGSINGITTYFHRLVLNAAHGEYVDHINSDSLDNRRENLRLCTSSQNVAHRLNGRPNSTGYRGVHVCRGKWVAAIKAKGIKHRAGTFQTALDAAIAYDHLALHHFGEFAVLNFPREWRTP